MLDGADLFLVHCDEDGGASSFVLQVGRELLVGPHVDGLAVDGVGG